MITFNHVTVSYPGRGTVLEDVSFTIKEKEAVGLIGANGAGKSTLMKAALGLLDAEGEILIGGLKVEKKNLKDIRSRLGYVLQDSDNQMFMPTVLEDMIFGPMNYGSTRQEAEKRALETLSSLDIDFLAERQNHRISGGEKRMAAIATILTMDPDALLMDEPSAALDPKNRRRIINIINGLDKTMLIASHDLDFILETCDRVILLSEGKIAAEGPAYQILSDKALLEENSLELPFCLAGIPERIKNTIPS